MPQISTPYQELTRVISEQITSVAIHAEYPLPQPLQHQISSPSEYFETITQGTGNIVPCTPSYPRQHRKPYIPAWTVFSIIPKLRKRGKTKTEKESIDVKHPFDEQSFISFIDPIRNYLDKQREERRRQANTAFTITFSAIIIGIIMACASVACIFIFGISIGAIPTVSSVISNATSIVTFRFNKEANTRLDIIVREIGIFDRASVAMRFISMISDTTAKDAAIIDLAKDLQGTFR